MGTFKKNIPNIITSIRLIGAIVILFLRPFSLEFYIVYGACGVTDFLDGFIARKFHLQSKLGSILDSVADLLFLGIMAFKLVPVLLDVLELWNWLIILIPTGFHFIAYMICAFKFHKFSSLHTFSNKVLSASIFFYPFMFIGWISVLYNTYEIIGGVNAFYGGMEMILIHIIAPEYNDKNKTVYAALKARKEYKISNK